MVVHPYLLIAALNLSGKITSNHKLPWPQRPFFIVETKKCDDCTGTTQFKVIACQETKIIPSPSESMLRQYSWFVTGVPPYEF